MLQIGLLSVVEDALSSSEYWTVGSVSSFKTARAKLCVHEPPSREKDKRRERTSIRQSY